MVRSLADRTFQPSLRRRDRRVGNPEVRATRPEAGCPLAFGIGHPGNPIARLPSQPARKRQPMFFLTSILTFGNFWQTLRGPFSAGWLAGKPDYPQKLKVPEGYEKASIRLYRSQILQVDTK